MFSVKSYYSTGSKLIFLCFAYISESKTTIGLFSVAITHILYMGVCD